MKKQPSPQEMDWPKHTIFTVGHSTLPVETFVTLLHAYGIACVAEIRMVPRSRHNPQFNGDTLAHALKAENIDYVALDCLRASRSCRLAERAKNRGVLWAGSP